MGLEIVEKNIPTSNIKPGMLINLRYSKVAGGGGSYFVFVINPNKPDTRTNTPQLHAYNFGGVVNESQFINILVNLSSAVVLDPVNKELRLESVSDTEAYEAQYLVLSTSDKPYKRFNIGGIGSSTQLLIVLPPIVDSIISGNVVISNQASKRKLFACLQEEDIDCIKEIPEIASSIGKTKTQKEIEQEEASERENLLQTRKRSLTQILRGFFGLKR